MERGKTKKEKGKIKKQKKYLSLIIVPHSSDKVKTFSISSFKVKLTALLVSMTAIVVCTVIFVSNLVSENQYLKENVEEFCSLNIEQKKLIQEKIDEIQSLKTKQQNVDNIINNFSRKYREITNNYITSRIENNKISRSGDRTEHSFSNDIAELKDLLQSLSEINDSQDKNLLGLDETEEKLKAYLDSIPTLWPVSGSISAKFGYRMHPVYKRRLFHYGVDIAASYGVDIKAAASGKVIFSGVQSGYGYLVILDHGYGITTRYGHASKLIAKEGDTVKKGDVIAKVGSTGVSTGPHLHFEVRLNGNPVDPLQYLQ